MDEQVRNRVAVEALTDAAAEAAIGRIGARDAARGVDARGVYDTLTFGEGPGVLSQAQVQDWLWYRLPTKYLTDEPGYMGRLAGVAAELFDELGLDAHAALCRSATTAGVHQAFDRSDAAGFAAMRKAMAGSGIEPPDLADFEWSEVMGIEESSARGAVEHALERAMTDGVFAVGDRGWRTRQRQVAAATLDSDHPEQPGQTWRTAVITERISRWIDEPRHRWPALSAMRARVANRLIAPVEPPPDVAERMAPVCWLLGQFGDEQPLTAAGYLTPAFVRAVHAGRPWDDPYSPGNPRSEVDAIVLHRLRGFLQTIGAVRKHRAALRRTSAGSKMVDDPAAAWEALTRHPGSDPWPAFVVETAGVVLVDAGGPISESDVRATVTATAAALGWRTSGHTHGSSAPTQMEVSWAMSDMWACLRAFGMLDETGDWEHRHWSLTPAGRSTMLATLRRSATGPMQRPS